MAKTLYLHIGHYKTGTTALQSFLTINDKALLRQGLDYLSSGRHYDKHSTLAFAIYRAAGVTELMHGFAQPRKPIDVWNTMFDAVRASRSPNVMISSEEFIRLGAHPKAVRILHDIIDTVRAEFSFRVVVYLRAPQSHLRSWYNQLVKMNQMPVPDFNTAVCHTMEPVHYDYALALRPWVDIFGADAVVVRPYTEALRNGTALFDDFLSILGLSGAGQLKQPGHDLNPRLDDKTLDITRLLQTAGYEGKELDWARTQVEKVMATRPDLSQNFTDVTQRAAAGLGALRGNGVDVSAFETDLPHPQDRDLATLTDLLVHVLGDMQLLRRNLHQRQADLAARITALETQSPGKKDHAAQPSKFRNPTSWIFKP